MIMDICGATHRGGRRDHNEDNIYIDGLFRSDVRMQDQVIRGDRRDGCHILAVFDGLGGGEYGELASVIAARQLSAAGGDALADPDVFVKDYLMDVHHRIRWLTENRDLRDMGTTAAMLITDQRGMAHVANLGDSRVYLYRDGLISQVSRDHTQIQMMIDSGIITDRRSVSRSFGHLLTQYAGIPSESGAEPEPYTDSFLIRSGDILLLCSDGLTDVMDDSEIAGILQDQSGSGADSIVLHLIKTAIDRKSRDNVSVIINRII